MLVSKDGIPQVVDRLHNEEFLSLDCETTGLRPYHGDRLFSLIIGTGHTQYYFNFYPYTGLSDEFILDKSELLKLQPVFSNKAMEWTMHNSKFDMSMLRMEGYEIAGRIHDTMVVERLLANDEVSYSLSSVAKRWGFEKDDSVEKWIKDNSAWEWRSVPGRGTRKKNKQYFKVPLELIQPYAETDAKITHSIAQSQKARLKEINDSPIPLSRIYELERKLLPTVSRMEKNGVRVDPHFCERAIRYQEQRMARAVADFKEGTGRDYLASPILFKDVFASEKDKWGETDKGNPSFESDVLQNFSNPAAKAVLEIRDAKSKKDFFSGFSHHMDGSHTVHPNFNQAGTSTGRFSSSDPNFQNLSNEEKAVDEEYPTRRAIIPREDHCFIMPDYSAMEYRLMLDYACNIVGYETPLTAEVKEGKDVHQATADLVTAGGFQLDRSRAKNGNFATLYGSGAKTLAKTLGTTDEEARRVKAAIFRAAPEIQRFIQSVMKCASQRGYIFNWMGRRCLFPDSSFAYKAPNYLIQGGCADIVKAAMVQIDEYLTFKKSKLVMTVHDELVVEVHKSEIDTVPKQVVKIMESVFPSKYLPMVVSMEHSWKSLADKVGGYPT